MEVHVPLKFYLKPFKSSCNMYFPITTHQKRYLSTLLYCLFTYIGILRKLAMDLLQFLPLDVYFN